MLVSKKDGGDDDAESMGVDGMDIEGKVRSTLVEVPTRAKAPLLLLCKAYARHAPPPLHG